MLKQNWLEKILSVIGASKRFVLQPCDNINNAVAKSYKGIRYILYDRQFMNSISNGNNWGNLFILAHEVGHHINGHSLDLVLYMAEVVEPKSLALKRKQELEADEFAGFILSKLGGSLQDARTSIINVSSTGDDSYSTHPSRDKRLAAVEKGFNNAKSSEPPAITKEDLATEFFYKGVESSNKGNYEEAINYYTTSINLDPNISSSYFNRGNMYDQMENYTLAMNDYTQAINLNKNIGDYFFNRALLNMNLATSREDNKMFMAIKDLETAIKINPNDADYHYNLGMCKYRSIGWFSACKHFQKASSLARVLPQFVLDAFKNNGCK